jgi:hypothetical protein
MTLRLGVALPQATTLPGYPHDDQAILAALDAWAERIGHSIWTRPLYPRLFPIWCNLGRPLAGETAPIGTRPPSTRLLDALTQRGVQSIVYLETSGWLSPGVPNRPNASYLAGDHDADLRL